MNATEIEITYGPIIQSVAAAIGIPPIAGGSENYVKLVSGIISKESAGDPNATGDSGCSVGLMQLNTCAGWLQSFGYSGEDLFNPATNISYGCQYLNSLLTKYNNVDQAVSAYNAGSPTSSNANYVNAVLGFVNQLGGFVQSNPLLSIGGAILVTIGVYSLFKQNA